MSCTSTFWRSTGPRFRDRPDHFPQTGKNQKSQGDCRPPALAPCAYAPDVGLSPFSQAHGNPRPIAGSRAIASACGCIPTVQAATGIPNNSVHSSSTRIDDRSAAGSPVTMVWMRSDQSMVLLRTRVAQWPDSSLVHDIALGNTQIIAIAADTGDRRWCDRAGSRRRRRSSSSGSRALRSSPSCTLPVPPRWMTKRPASLAERALFTAGIRR